MTPERIKELRAMCKEAEPGPWGVTEANIKAMLAASKALPESLDEIEDLTAWTVELRHINDVVHRARREMADEIKQLKADLKSAKQKLVGEQK